MEEQRKSGRPKVATKMQHVGFTLTPELIEELEKRAKERGVTVSAFVRA